MVTARGSRRRRRTTHRISAGRPTGICTPMSGHEFHPTHQPRQGGGLRRDAPADHVTDQLTGHRVGVHVVRSALLGCPQGDHGVGGAAHAVNSPCLVDSVVGDALPARHRRHVDVVDERQPGVGGVDFDAGLGGVHQDVRPGEHGPTADRDGLPEAGRRPPAHDRPDSRPRRRRRRGRRRRPDAAPARLPARGRRCPPSPRSTPDPAGRHRRPPGSRGPSPGGAGRRTGPRQRRPSRSGRPAELRPRPRPPPPPTPDRADRSGSGSGGRCGPRRPAGAGPRPTRRCPAHASGSWCSGPPAGWAAGLRPRGGSRPGGAGSSPRPGPGPAGRRRPALTARDRGGRRGSARRGAAPRGARARAGRRSPARGAGGRAVRAARRHRPRRPWPRP